MSHRFLDTSDMVPRQAFREKVERIKELEAENERLAKKYNKSLEMMAGRAEIINQLQAELAAVRAELAECRQAAFENGREVGERSVGYGELEY